MRVQGLKGVKGLVAGVAVAGLVVSSCGTPPADEADGPIATIAPVITLAPTPLPKPEVVLPTTIPTTLITTDLAPGTGAEAGTGDTVVVHYLGVLSADGKEFDNSYERGTPFPVTIGAGGVIPGWEQGLIGVQKGGRRQLDIPSDLAYGDAGRGEIIKGGDALTFVIDVVAVIPGVDPAKEPQVTVTGAANRKDVATEDLVVGTGDAISSGQTVVTGVIIYRADTGAELTSSWETGETLPLKLSDTIPGLATGMAGMRVGGVRKIVIPFSQAFGSGGSAGIGLPGNTDLVIVVEVLGAY